MTLSKSLAAFVSAAALTLAACSQSDETPKPVDENPTGLAISNARLILPAVSGNPAVVYFDVVNEGKRAIAVRSADVADAKSTTMHGMVEVGGKMTMQELMPTPIAPGQAHSFKPGGDHLMAFEVSPTLKAGDKTELTLTVAGGDKVSTQIDVQPAGAER